MKKDPTIDTRDLRFQAERDAKVSVQPCCCRRRRCRSLHPRRCLLLFALWLLL